MRELDCRGAAARFQAVQVWRARRGLPQVVAVSDDESSLPVDFDNALSVESFVLLSALGGDCVDDFDGLRRDLGLAALLGYTLPAAATARQ